MKAEISKNKGREMDSTGYFRKDEDLGSRLKKIGLALTIAGAMTYGLYRIELNPEILTGSKLENKVQTASSAYQTNQIDYQNHQNYGGRR